MTTGPLRKAWPEALCLSAAAAILAWQLLVAPFVGLADNGDFARVMAKFGLIHAPEAYADRYFGWIVADYKIHPSNVWVSGFTSTQTLFVQLALAAHQLAGVGSVFDIRVLGAVHTVFYLVALGLVLLAARRLPAAPRVVALVLLLVAATDVGTIAYFNSFYSESAALIAFAGMTGCGLLLSDRSGGSRVPLLAGFLACAAALICSKPQFAILSPPIAAWAIAIGFRQKARGWKVISLLSAAALLATSVDYVRKAPPAMREAYLYDVVFFEILAQSPDPARDLDELGLDRSLARFARTTAFHPGIPIQDPTFRRNFFSRVDYGALVRFYLRHPVRFVRLLARSSRMALETRPPNLGNFTKESGAAPLTQSHGFALWGTFKAGVLPQSLAFLTLFFAGQVALLAWTARARPDTLPRGLWEAWAAVLAIALLQFLLCAGGEGNYELVKHLFLFNVTFDALVIGLCVWVAARLSARAAVRASPATRPGSEPGDSGLTVS